MELIFATNNKHKLEEIQALLSNKFRLLSLIDINCNDEIPEDFHTLEENASQKAWYIYNKFKRNCFADDTGLEVDFLNGKPGVFSARYAGDNKDSQANIDKVLSELKNAQNRKARFRTVISLLIDGNEIQFEGIVEGSILENRHGSAGFGYDPIFLPDGYNLSFAEMPLSEKNKISHRAKAINKLVDYLKKTI
ncbi:MAG: non-canonical purine NTP pyrophosphatase [Bacteroidetes bacterium GWF2_33_16]|nr:MAG: non-canonical purine NTP pyrophosphatase [Bacteroidetes bacterium GWE2_32_14]OFY07618.1 MAG: non-canonical purine NTP pyrophosphatase [Bacteroidetes bacterium GWF2_33_16]